MSSAASFIDQINTEYREVVKAENAALPHAIKCGEFLKLAKENLKAERGGKWKDWLETNCPEIAQETASLYMRLADHKAKVGKAKSIREARELLPKAQPRGPTQPDADKPSGGFVREGSASSKVEDELTNLAPDELCPKLVASWDDDELAQLAKLINEHLARKKAVASAAAGISNAVTNSPTPVRRPL